MIVVSAPVPCLGTKVGIEIAVFLLPRSSAFAVVVIVAVADFAHRMCVCCVCAACMLRVELCICVY